MTERTRDDAFLREQGDVILQGVRAIVAAALHHEEAAANLNLLADAATNFVVNLIEDIKKARPPKQPFACDKGCSFCCHQYEVSVTALEALRIASHVEEAFSEAEKTALLERIGTFAVEKAKHPPTEKPLAIFECCFLVDGECSIYPVRPLMCHAVNSISARTCETSYSSARAVPLVQAYRPQPILAQAGAKAIELAIADAGLDARMLELNTAVRAALPSDDAAENWLKGGAVFKPARSAVAARFDDPFMGKG